VVGLTSAILEIGAPADLALLHIDPRGAPPGTVKAAAIIRGGHVMEGMFPAATNRSVATDRPPAVLKGLMNTDVALASRLARDLDGAFPTLVAEHQDRLFTIALRLLGDPRDAEEVAQDALVRAYRAIGTYSRDRIETLHLRAWLGSITMNLARNRRRRLDDRRPPVALEPMLDAGFELTDAASPGPAAVAARREHIEELAATLLQLQPAIRAAIVLRHVDGLSVAETAEALGRPEGTIKAQVSRGLERLRVLLESAPSTDRIDQPVAFAHRPSTETRRVAAEVLR
jgi:RNA polymerase sigma factor (sigma-70 family)